MVIVSFVLVLVGCLSGNSVGLIPVASICLKWVIVVWRMQCYGCLCSVLFVFPIMFVSVVVISHVCGVWVCRFLCVIGCLVCVSKGLHSAVFIAWLLAA